MSPSQTRRAHLGALLALPAAAALPTLASAQAFPAKPVRVIVPYTAGGADSYVRPLQPMLERRHGITLVIESVPGAGGTLGANRVKRSPPDGYTLLFCGSGALTVAPRLQGDTLSVNDLAPMLNLVTMPYVVAVRKDSPLRTGRDFIDHVTRHPGQLSYGTPGVGSTPHVAMEAVLATLKTSANHVPYAGISAATQALLGGHLDAVIGAPSNLLPQVRSGQLVALAVSSKQRFPFAPQIPTLAELGVAVDMAVHFGFLAPKGTDPRLLDKLVAALRDAAADPAFKSVMDNQLTPVELLDGPAYAQSLAAEAAAFDPVVAKLPRQ